MTTRQDLGRDTSRTPAEGELMPVRKLRTPVGAARDTLPTRGGQNAAGVADDKLGEVTEGSSGEPLTHREVYILGRRGAGRGDTPLFRTGERDGGSAAPVFTDRDHALLYLQSSGWGDAYEPTALSPLDLVGWVDEVRGRGVGYLAVDPNRLAQTRGEPQPALEVGSLDRFSGDALYRELRDIREQPAL